MSNPLYRRILAAVFFATSLLALPALAATPRTPAQVAADVKAAGNNAQTIANIIEAAVKAAGNDAQAIADIVQAAIGAAPPAQAAGIAGAAVAAAPASLAGGIVSAAVAVASGQAAAITGAAVAAKPGEAQAIVAAAVAVVPTAQVAIATAARNSGASEQAIALGVSQGLTLIAQNNPTNSNTPLKCGASGC